MMVHHDRLVKLRAIQQAHEAMEKRYADAPFNVAKSMSRPEGSDYNLHDLDVDPPSGADEFFISLVNGSKKSVDTRLVKAELEALARHLSKGRNPNTWSRVHLAPVDVESLTTLIGKGVPCKAAVDRVAERWVDIGGQIHDTEDEPDDLSPLAVGDGHPVGSGGGLGGGAQLPHDANDHYFDRSDLKPHGDWEQGTATKGAADPHDPNPVEAEHVYNQLLENYPPKAIKWVKKASWIGPIEVPIDRVDTDDVKKWAAYHQQHRVDHFAKKLNDGEDVKPAVCVQEPGENRVKVIDGHHRYLGAKAAGKKTFRAYVGFVRKNGGAWDETHVYQFHQGADPQNKVATLSKDEVDYRPHTDPRRMCSTCSMYQVSGDDDSGSCTLVKGIIAGDAVCDRWDAKTRLKAMAAEMHKAGNAAALQHWYLSGAGINWGQPGDFAACVRIAGRHLSNPEGFCAEMHHRALGEWPGQEKIAKGKKKKDKLVAAGLVVRADDTGRVLMLQRAMDDDDDPAAGSWEFPGGRLEDDESPFDAAVREWEEETGLESPDTEPVASWRSPNEKYQGFVITVPHETDLDILGRRDAVPNPDDSDGDHVESLAWWDPKDLATSTAVREELRQDAGHVAAALNSITKLFTILSSTGKMATGSDGEENGSQMAEKLSTQEIIKAVKDGFLTFQLEQQAEKQAVADYVTLAWPDTVKYSSSQPRDAHGRFAGGGKKHGGGGGWLKAGGNVDSSQLSLKKNGDVVHKPTGTVIAHVNKQADTPVKGTSTFITHHADGTKVYSGVYKGKAMVAVAQHHNEAHAKASAPKLEETPKPVETLKPVAAAHLTEPHVETPKVSEPATPQPWHKAGSNVEAKDLSLKLNGDVVHKPTGTVIAHVEKLKDTPVKGTSTFITTHADGTKVYDSVYKGKALAAVATHHNAAMTGKLTHAEPAETVKPTEAPKPPKPPAPEYHKAGSEVKPQDVVAKKDGTLVHKQTGVVLGSIEKSYGYWKSTHVDGFSSNYNNTKKEALKKVIDHHNLHVAVEKAVEPNVSTEWSAHSVKPHQLAMKAGAGESVYGVNHVDVVHNVTGEKLGTIDSNTVGNTVAATHVITHVSGAKVSYDGPKHLALVHLSTMHNAAAKIAEGKVPDAVASTPVKAFEPHTAVAHEAPTHAATAPEGGKQPYEKVGTISAGSLHGTNVQKDSTGKIIGSDMSHGDAVIGHTKANADGTLTLTHADGHVIATDVKPGTGQATAKLAEYHNTKYDDSTLPKPEVKAPPKIEPTETSLQPGGLHNDPAASYSPDTPEAYKNHYKTAENESAGHTVLNGVKPSADFKLTSAEKAAIKYYTGSGYVPMHEFLRKGKISAYNHASVLNHIEQLDSAFAKMPELKKTTVTYRGGDFTSVLGPVGSKVGSTFTDHGYGSTAASPYKAFGGNTILRVTIPAGTHVLRPSSVGSYGDGESEILLARGTTYRVMRDEMQGHMRVVDVVVEGSAMQ